MPNPSEPDPTEPTEPGPADQNAPELDEPGRGEQDSDDPVTEVLVTESEPAPESPPERRFTAPGFDATATEVMPSVQDAATEMIAAQSGKATPKQILPRLAGRLPATASRSWGWVMALVLIILVLAVAAVLGTLWLTHSSQPKASQEDRVRETIQSFDVAVQTGDLAALRSLTCGDIRDRYVNYDQGSWDDTYRRIAAAKQYPVVASIDEVVVNDGQAEANVTAFMAYEPRVRSTRSFDLQYRDDQWKICQSHTG